MFEFKKLEMSDKRVRFTIDAQEETIPVYGNAIESGDPEADRKVENEILDRLEKGDVWAWAAVTVTAYYGGFTGTDHLGCCSYQDEDDFKAGGYWKDMKERSLEELNASIEEALNDIKPLLVDDTVKKYRVDIVASNLATEYAETLSDLRSIAGAAYGRLVITKGNAEIFCGTPDQLLSLIDAAESMGETELKGIMED